jgi:hypothetical protein
MIWPLVRVTWLDSSGPSGWNRLKSVIGPFDLTCESVGWLMEDTPDRVTLCAHVAISDPDNPIVDGVMTIPKCAIKRRKVLVKANA